MDFDPRDYDSRDEERFAPDRGRGGKDDRDDQDREDDPRQPDIPSRDRDDSDVREPGRGPGESRQSEKDEHAPRDETRWSERVREDRPRDTDPREAFTRHLNLPRGIERELVRDRDREYTLRASESRTLATVGAFRVVSSRDLRDHNDRPCDPRSGTLRHLREQGLVETRSRARLPRAGGHLDEGRPEPSRAPSRPRPGRPPDVLQRRETRAGAGTRCPGLSRLRTPRRRLAERGARIDRVLLDYELKREYQKWLHERDRGRDDYDGHPDRTAEEIREWALEHDLPYFEDEIHFPDLRIEYELDGRLEHRDVEVTTEHYRCAHGASVAKSRFSCYRASSARIGGGSSRGGGSPFDPDVAEEFVL